MLFAKNNVRIVTVIIILAFLFSFANASPANAAGATLTSSDIIASSSHCPRGKLVINVTHKVVNDVDSGVAGNNWAVDNYNRHIQVWQVEPDMFCVVVSYEGSFVTLAGRSPGDTDDIAAGITGTFQGGYVSTVFNGTLNPSPVYRTHGNIGTFDYDYGNSNWSWTSAYFSSNSFNFASWGWTYHGGKNGTWINSSEGNQGDITD